MDSWVLNSFIVLIILAVLDIFNRYLMLEGFRAIELVTYSFIPLIFIILLYIYTKDITLMLPNFTQTAIFIIVGILFFFSFLLLRKAQIQSSNIGYVNAIVYSSVLVTIISTSVVFNDKLKLQGLLGSLFIVLGLGLITSKPILHLLSFNGSKTL